MPRSDSRKSIPTTTARLEEVAARVAELLRTPEGRAVLIAGRREARLLRDACLQEQSYREPPPDRTLPHNLHLCSSEERFILDCELLLRVHDSVMPTPHIKPFSGDVSDAHAKRRTDPNAWEHAMWWQERCKLVDPDLVRINEAMKAVELRLVGLPSWTRGWARVRALDIPLDQDPDWEIMWQAAGGQAHIVYPAQYLDRVDVDLLIDAAHARFDPEGTGGHTFWLRLSEERSIAERLRESGESVWEDASMILVKLAVGYDHRIARSAEEEVRLWIMTTLHAFRDEIARASRRGIDVAAHRDELLEHLRGVKAPVIDITNPPPKIDLNQFRGASVESLLKVEQLMKSPVTSNSATPPSQRSSAPQNSTASTADSPAAEETFSRLVVDRSSFSVRWRGKVCSLGYTKAYELIERLHRSSGQYIPIQQLVNDVWGQSAVTDGAVRRQASQLRSLLAKAGMEDVTIDGSEKGHYALITP